MKVWEDPSSFRLVLHIIAFGLGRNTMDEGMQKWVVLQILIRRCAHLQLVAPLTSSFSNNLAREKNL